MRNILTSIQGVMVAVAMMVMSSSPVLADDAKSLAEKLRTGDSRVEVISKMGSTPSYKETRRVLGVETETLTFKVGFTSAVIVDLVFDRIVAVQTKSVLPWESH
ncbi:hypothetical protein [Magnetospirillum sp. 15-1]|uniref:hypothetical protein n=1 Tax=Magnetospirillum sp. 15-1 TaxID=1979370 RepID=UPI001143E89E|nr:hypothetical protein [Magnetospirillum sp. 15-1]